MDGMLSQDEINALLSGMNAGSSDPQPDPQPAATEEILTDIEKDAIGEIANISMGTSATTLYSLVNRKVNITTPTVSIANWKNFIDEQEKPCVFIQIKYTEGLDGANILIMRERDVKVITDLMMGGDGSNIDGELGELHLSAISEAMNQMMGSSATSLSSMLGRMIDISPPEASLVNILENKNGADIAPFLGGDFVKIEFRMQIEDLVDSTIMQLYPIDFAKSLYKIFMEQRSSCTAGSCAAATVGSCTAATAGSCTAAATAALCSTAGRNAADAAGNATNADAADATDAAGKYTACTVPGIQYADATADGKSGKYRSDHGCTAGGYCRAWQNKKVYCGDSGFYAGYDHRTG